MTTSIDDYDFVLPPELIAQFPAATRSASRLLLPRCTGAHTCEDRSVTDLPALLNPGDVLVFNETRVIKARLFATKETGGRVEMLIERVTDAAHALAHIRASHAPKPGMRLTVAEGVSARVIEKRDALTLLRFDQGPSVFDVMAAHGAVPLPPYIEHAAGSADEDRYQTVYAKHPGAVAAPTAGLHFDAPLFAALEARGVETAFLTLHVGAGTFQPVRVTNIAEHIMHSEWYEVPEATAQKLEAARARGSNIIAVGTTSMRALESAALRAHQASQTHQEPTNSRAAQAEQLLARGADDTAIFITPGFQFRVVDKLLTNFHLPKSTLMMLVSAFAGHARIKQAYAHAINERYRFFSYGDAMLLTRGSD
jgi:S-adenosylmethionine:tRNA ribosyltransferase-isomerase